MVAVRRLLVLPILVGAIVAFSAFAAAPTPAQADNCQAEQLPPLNQPPLMPEESDRSEVHRAQGRRMSERRRPSGVHRGDHGRNAYAAFRTSTGKLRLHLPAAAAPQLRRVVFPRQLIEMCRSHVPHRRRALGGLVEVRADHHRLVRVIGAGHHGGGVDRPAGGRVAAAGFMNG